MSKFIVKNLVTELGGQFVVLKREKQGDKGQRGFQSVYSVLDGNTLAVVGEFTDKERLREFIEDQEWGQKAKEREARKAGLAETLAAGTTASSVVTTSTVVDEDDDETDAEPFEVAHDHGIQQPPV